MKCHYVMVKGVGKVLIPGCMGGAVHNSLDFCTCKKPAQIKRHIHNEAVNLLQLLTNACGAEFENEKLAVQIIEDTLKANMPNE